MIANLLKRILRKSHRARKPNPNVPAVRDETKDLSPTQRAIARAARKNPWLLAG